MNQYLKYPSLPRTQETLDKLSRVYNKNFNRMMYCADDRLRTNAVKRENKLENMCVTLRKEMGIYTYDPCPLKGKTCEKCTGYTKSKNTVNKKGKVKTKQYMASPEDGEKCRLVKYVGKKETYSLLAG